MAQPLMRKTKRIVVVGLMLPLLGATAAGGTENLPDPTRPPSIFERPDADSRAAPDSTPVLQSVLIAPGRAVATIDGREMKVGDSLGSARIVKIGETEVLLRNGKELEILKLFPAIEKQTKSGNSDTRAGRQRP
jgi:MSHA biogenesis protein MshK